jgi:hypothetical protein
MSNWMENGINIVTEFAKDHSFLCSDDLWPLTGPPPDELHNGMGALISAASKMGIIEATGRIVRSKRPDAKGRNIQVWMSVSKRGPLLDVESWIKDFNSSGQSSLL